MRRAAVLAALALCACRTMPDPVPPCGGTSSGPVPAAVSEDDIEILRAILAEELGRRPIVFGEPGPAGSDRVVVLPPPLSPLEGRSTVEPILFRVFSEDGFCFLARSDSDRVFSLGGISCDPL